MDKKVMLLISVFSLVTLISSIVCTSLIYFNEKDRTEINGNSVVASKSTYISTSIVYEDNNNLNISSLMPGNNITQSFSITNNNSNTIKYSIKWQNITSTWKDSSEFQIAHPEEFVYHLNCTNGEVINNKQMPINNDDEYILRDLELKTNQVNTCTIRFEFVNREIDQSYNFNKQFGGTYKVIVEE